MGNRYLLRPKADRDLDDQADYLADVASPEVAHRFLVAAHETFALLANQPRMGWRSKLRHPQLSQMRIFRVSRFERTLILYLPNADGIEVLRVVHGSRNLQALLSREGIE